MVVLGGGRFLMSELPLEGGPASKREVSRTPDGVRNGDHRKGEGDT